MPEAAPLSGNAQADVCVIGAGVAGITTAYLLAQKGRTVVVIDEGAIGGGMTSCNTGELAVAMGGHAAIERRHGIDGARLAAASQAGAIDAVEGIVRREEIACDFERVGGYLAAAAGPGALALELESAERAGVPGIELVAAAPLDGVRVGEALRFPRQAQLHPLKYLAGLARAIVRDRGEIHCGTHVSQVRGGGTVAITTREGYRIDCDAAVVAADVPVGDMDAMAAHLTAGTRCILGIRIPRGTVPRELLRELDETVHFARSIPDLEPHGEILLVGEEPAGHEVDAGERFQALERWMRVRYPMAREILYRWTERVAQSHDGLAYIGASLEQQNVFIAAGDCGLRLVNGTIGALVVTDLVHGAEVPWAELYDPARGESEGERTFAQDALHAAWLYARRAAAIPLNAARSG